MILPVIKIALRALARNKVRSALTMLGIIIGVASVIAMVSLGQGAQKPVSDQISSMGTHMLIVSAGSQRTAGVRGGSGTASTTDRSSSASRSRSGTSDPTTPSWTSSTRRTARAGSTARASSRRG